MNWKKVIYKKYISEDCEYDTVDAPIESQMYEIMEGYVKGTVLTTHIFQGFEETEILALDNDFFLDEDKDAQDFIKKHEMENLFDKAVIFQNSNIREYYICIPSPYDKETIIEND